MNEIFLVVITTSIVGCLAGYFIARMKTTNHEISSIRLELSQFRKDIDETRIKIASECRDELRSKLNSLDSYELQRITNRLDDIGDTILSKEQLNDSLAALYRELVEISGRITDFSIEFSSELSDMHSAIDNNTSARVIGFRPERLRKQ